MTVGTKYQLHDKDKMTTNFTFSVSSTWLYPIISITTINMGYVGFRRVLSGLIEFRRVSSSFVEFHRVSSGFVEFRCCR